jgi:hypothetical protein
MAERAAVLLGAVQFGLRIKVIVHDNATPEGIEKAAWAMIADDPVRYWTLFNDLASGRSVALSRNDFLEAGLQRVETSVPDDQQPEVLWEKEN